MHSVADWDRLNSNNIQLKTLIEGRVKILCMEWNPRYYFGTLEGKFKIEVHVCTSVKQTLHGMSFDLLLKCWELCKLNTGFLWISLLYY